MDDLQSKLNAVLNDPEAMSKVMALAQNFNQQEQISKQESPEPSMPSFDPAMLQRIVGLSKNASVDKNQQSLLKALSPYLSRQRIQKLEKAMRAAKMASMAGLLTGR